MSNVTHQDEHSSQAGSPEENFDERSWELYENNYTGVKELLEECWQRGGQIPGQKFSDPDSRREVVMHRSVVDSSGYPVQVSPVLRIRWHNSGNVYVDWLSPNEKHFGRCWFAASGRPFGDFESFYALVRELLPLNQDTEAMRQGQTDRTMEGRGGEESRPPSFNAISGLGKSIRNTFRMLLRRGHR